MNHFQFPNNPDIGDIERYTNFLKYSTKPEFKLSKTEALQIFAGTFCATIGVVLQYFSMRQEHVSEYILAYGVWSGIIVLSLFRLFKNLTKNKNDETKRIYLN